MHSFLSVFCTAGELISHILQEADFKDMIYAAQDMEDRYGYLFEKVVINDDPAAAFAEIRAELDKLEKEVNWIPKIWAGLKTGKCCE